jgi:cytochrome c553
MRGLARRCFCMVILLAAGLQVCIADSAASRRAPAPDGACAACHGAGGNKPISPETPRLAGQQYDYLVEALQQYRSSARHNPIMGAMAQSLSDAQIRELAKYFSGQSGLTEKY